LPADIGSFTGREQAMAGLDTLLAAARVAAVTGIAGVGKTALAVHGVAVAFAKGRADMPDRW
jgi:hypothetical protein